MEWIFWKLINILRKEIEILDDFDLFWEEGNCVKLCVGWFEFKF